MAWRDSLLDCKFRGVTFDVVGTRDVYGRAVSVAEFPYRDGGETEDLGARPTRFSLQAIFIGDDYETRLRTLLAALDLPGVGELIHPVWGSIERAQLAHVEVSHAAPEPDACTLVLEFVESAVANPFFAEDNARRVKEKVGAAGDAAVAASTAATAKAVEAVRKVSPLARLDALRKSMLGPLLDMAAKVQGVIASGLEVLNHARAWAADIATLSNALKDILATPGKLMAEWRAITGQIKGIGALWGFGSSPKRSEAAGGAVWPVAEPWVPGTVPTEAQVQNVVLVHLSVVNAAVQADAAALVFDSAASDPALTAAEIETVIDDVRGEIEAAIAAARAALSLEESRAIVEPLKDMALALQDAARSVLEQRPPLLRRTIEAPGNLRLIAHRWYGDHARAPELLRLNSIRQPNALQPGDVLNALAA